MNERLERYLELIERDRPESSSEMMLAREIRRLRGLRARARYRSGVLMTVLALIALVVTVVTRDESWAFAFFVCAAVALASFFEARNP